MRRIILLIPIFLLMACTGTPNGLLAEKVDPAHMTIYHNGIVLTMDDGLPRAEAIAIRGEMIEQVGSNEEILALGAADTTVVDLGGRVVMPGFVDAHTHLLNDHLDQGNSLDEAQSQALKNGITSLATLYVDKGFLDEIQAFDEAGFLRVRTGLYLVHTDPCGRDLGDWWKAYPPTRTPGEMLRINGVKIFADGGSCGKVALSFELEPGTGTGDLWYTLEKLTAMIAEVDAVGYQAAVHAIGDRAVVQALNAYEAVLKGQPNTLRHRMEHVSVIPAAQLGRFGQLGIIPVLLGEYPGCTPYGPPIPTEYAAMEWPWRALRTANPGLPIAWHSDVPFQSLSPFDHMLGFTTRIDTLDRAVCPPQAWLQDDTLTLDETLSIMTIQSATALWRDDEVGSLTPGKLADFIVLFQNPYGLDPGLLATNRVLLTVVGGRTEYCWSAKLGLCPGFTNRIPVPLPDTRPPLALRWLAALLLVVLPTSAMLLRKRRAGLVQKIGAWAGVAAGIFWLITLFLPGWTESALLFVAPSFLMGLGTVGLAALWSQGRLGKVGLWLALIGAIAFSEFGVVTDWFLNDFGWGLFILGLLIHATGLILFGIANAKGRIFLRLNTVPLWVGIFAGPVPLLLGSVLPNPEELPQLLIAGVLGIGWLGMGWLLMMASRNPLPAA